MSALLEEQPQQDAVSSWMFFRTLKASKLLSPDEIADWEERASRESFGNIQNKMIEEGVLTPYQLKRIVDSNPYQLVMGQYVVLDELGKGGCGFVYKARHKIMDRIVALKMIGNDANRSLPNRELFIREVVAMTSLVHPNIAASYDANEDDKQLYFAMEYIEGPTLQQLIQQRGPLPISVACSYLLQAAEALCHAHERCIIHRDIKPANLILTNDQSKHALSENYPNRLKILDFGLCRLTENRTRQLMTIPFDAGAVVGTPAFISPEQINNFHNADPRSDLYSLGCTFYYALTGKIPFDGLTTKATLLLHLEIDPQAMSNHRTAIPDGLTVIINRLMAKKPSDRYASANDLILAINHFILGGGLAETDTVPPSLIQESIPCQSTEYSTNSRIQIDSQKFKSDIIPLEIINSSHISISEAGILKEQFYTHWMNWCELVFRLANGRRMEMTPAHYKILHRDLIFSIQEMIKQHDAETVDNFNRMSEIVMPWVNLKSIATNDRKTLLEILSQCNSIEKQIGNPKKQTLLFQVSFRYLFTILGIVFFSIVVTLMMKR